MRRAKKSLVAAAIGMAGIVSAQASVVYNWNPIDDIADFSTNGGQLVLTDSAYADGRAVFDGFTNDNPNPDRALFPDSQIVNVALAITNPGGLAGDAFSIAADPGKPSAVGNDIYSLKSDLSVIGDMLHGSLDLVTQFDEFHMTAADNGLWTINKFNSDAGSYNCYTNAYTCAGATGHWRLASNVGVVGGASDVPAPAVWALFGLAVLGMFGWHGAGARAA